VDYGDADTFLAEQFRPELLKSACEKANIPLTLHRQQVTTTAITSSRPSWPIICAGMPRV
jgi:hypothetical protein